VWLALSAHFILSVGWQRFFFLQVTYPNRYMLESHGFLIPNLHGELNLQYLPRLLRQLAVYSTLAAYPAMLWHCWRRRRVAGSQQDMPIVLLALSGLLLTLQVITRANWTRIYVVAPPALVLLSWWVVRFTSTAFRRTATIAAGCFIACLAIIQTHALRHSGYRIATLPAGVVALPATKFEIYTWIQPHTKPGDYFFQANWVDVYLPLSLRDAVFAEDFAPDERTLPEWITLAVSQLEQRQVQYILWSPEWSDPDHAESPGSDHLEPLRAYMRSHYIKVHVFSNQDEIWQRVQPH
jgi:hypothetical protein